jgi:hypothetical protein
MSRPKSVLLLQLIAFLVLLSGVPLGARTLIIVPLKLISVSWLINLFIILLFCLLLIIALQKPSPLARWAGFLSIIFIAFLILILPLELNNSPYHAENEAQSGGALIGQILLGLFIVFWGYCFAFSKKAKLFWSRNLE